jgi:hypothetical protein
MLEAAFLYAAWEGEHYYLVLKLDSGEIRPFVPQGITTEFDAPEGTRVRVLWGIREYTNPMTGSCVTAAVVERIGRLDMER